MAGCDGLINVDKLKDELGNGYMGAIPKDAPNDPLSEPVMENAKMIIGAGYDITKTYADAKQVKFSVLDYGYLNARGFIKANPNVGATQVSVISGKTAKEYSEKVSESLGIGIEAGYGDYVKFSGEYKDSFTKSKSVKANQMFVTARLSVPTRNIRITSSVSSIMANHGNDALDPGFKSDLKSMTAAELVKAYGTHVMTGGQWGVRVDYNLTARSSQEGAYEKVATAVSAKLEAKFSDFSAGASLDYSTEDEINSVIDTSSKEENIVIVGGGQQARALVGVGVFFDGPKESSFEEWAHSIQGDNDVWMDYWGTPGLVPITTFITDETKKAEVATYLSSYLANDGLLWDGAYATIDTTTGDFTYTGSIPPLSSTPQNNVPDAPIFLTSQKAMAAIKGALDYTIKITFTGKNEADGYYIEPKVETTLKFKHTSDATTYLISANDFVIGPDPRDNRNTHYPNVYHHKIYGDTNLEHTLYQEALLQPVKVIIPDDQVIDTSQGLPVYYVSGQVADAATAAGQWKPNNSADFALLEIGVPSISSWQESNMGHIDQQGFNMYILWAHQGQTPIGIGLPIYKSKGVKLKLAVPVHR